MQTLLGPGGILIDDDSTTTGHTYRVTRGGSFIRFGDLARCRRRHGWHPQQQPNATGFRLVESDN
jgi:formylglycine-generating enzyme required for sulfatase activity